MIEFAAVLLLLFFVFPLLGGAIAFLCGAIRPRFNLSGKALSGWHPLNPYYKLSPYHFGKR